MAEAWRRKTYYKPRVLIDVERVLDPQYDDALLCITGAQLELLRNLAQYLHRRSTFVSENHEGYYLVADNDDWDDIQAIVADLEETLMGCAEFTALFEDMLEQLECICDRLTDLDWDGPALPPLVDGYLDDGTLVDVDDNGDTVPADAERCALAQIVYWQAWQVVVNLIGPLEEMTLDLLLPILVGLLGSLAGGPVLGIPAALAIILVRGLIEAKHAGVLPDVLSEWEDAEEDVICALYRGLDTGYRDAETEAVKVIADLTVTLPSSKVFLHCMVSPWAIMVAKEAYDNASDFAVESVEAGYCDDCDEVVGSDWWALYMDKDTNTVEIDDPIGDGWTCGCWEFVVPAGQTVCGVVFEVKNKVGDIDIKRMDQDSCDCGDWALWGNNSGGDIADPGFYFSVDGTNIDEDACKAQLAPSAEIKTNGVRYTGPLQVSGTFVIGFSKIGGVDIHIAWVVFEGTSPP